MKQLAKAYRVGGGIDVDRPVPPVTPHDRSVVTWAEAIVPS